MPEIRPGGKVVIRHMRRGRPFALILTLVTASAWSSDDWASDEPMAASRALELAAARKLHLHPQWCRLLHADPNGGRSEILSPEFFLASDGRESPQAELTATILGWFRPTRDPDQHPRCRFPARYVWLATQLDLPEPTAKTPGCPRFERWAQLDKLDSISVLMVSGYLGNPASSFGHSLLKFNYRAAESGGRLLDISFNFGALVPPEEPTLLYIYRGLVGGYQAGFSDGLYYAQDQVYTRTEFRDIWEYELALSPAERTMLVAHLWEIAGKTFTYVFLTKNCTYRMAELLTLATETNFTPRALVWYVPVELFHRLEDVSRSDRRAIVADVRFIPSSQRLLYHKFAQLRAEEVAAANRVIAAGTSDVEAVLEGLSPDQRREVLDALVAYYEYRLAAEGEHPEPTTRQAKDRILRLRLRLPPSTGPERQIANLPPPTDGHRPMLVGAGVETVAGRGRFFVRVSPYFQDLLDTPASPDRGLVVLDAQGSADSRGDARLDFLDFIRVRNLQTNRVAIAGESRLSWQVRLGLTRREAGAGDLIPELSIGGGRSVLLCDNVLAYAMANAAAHAEDGILSMEPNLGLSARWGAVRTAFDMVESYGVGDGDWRTRCRFDGRLPLSRNREIALGLKYGEGENAVQVGVNTYW